MDRNYDEDLFKKTRTVYRRINNYIEFHLVFLGINKLVKALYPGILRESTETLLVDRRYEELCKDFKANQSRPSLSICSPMLEYASEVYIPSTFKVFHEEFIGIWNWRVLEDGIDETVKKYKVKSLTGKNHEHQVVFGISESLVDCSCKKFQFMGFLCRHVFAVLHHNAIVKDPKSIYLDKVDKECKIWKCR
ncbi:Protein FAR1-RELATED SEQUENCE 4 [Acorus gramineus]|uniref:Protein FAR1-RELATED SEQUENCE n=1 Tax=Acorus gramineus TaxID=55184 RepID=A0AAV9A267_ACOGR|nr:Protein FAR1-RELATED SEQUENCE 4 [Acorus gramineus]